MATAFQELASAANPGDDRHLDCPQLVVRGIAREDPLYILEA
jgi:hypothetical protein